MQTHFFRSNYEVISYWVHKVGGNFQNNMPFIFLYVHRQNSTQALRLVGSLAFVPLRRSDTEYFSIFYRCRTCTIFSLEQIFFLGSVVFRLIDFCFISISCSVFGFISICFGVLICIECLWLSMVSAHSLCLFSH